MNALGLWAAGFRLQFAISRRSPQQFLTMVTAPLFTVIFMSLALHNGDPVQITSAVVGPGLMSLWLVTLDAASSMLSEDRWYGRLELLIGSPGSLQMVILGRTSATTVVGSLAFVESWLVATMGFRVHVTVTSPGVVVLALLATMVATACTATMLSAIFMVSRAAGIFENSLSYPMYILGGVVVPIAAIPGWLHPLSEVIYLSWGAGLLRDAMNGVASNVLPRLTAILGLAAAALVAAAFLTRRISDRLRRTATAAFG